MTTSDFQELYELFNLAETKLKQIEILQDEGIPIPPLNQLRYAGHHTLEAIVSHNDQNKINNIYEAKDHCKRAIYDILEIGVVYLLEKIRIFQNDYKYIDITSVIPNYVDILDETWEAQNFISQINRNKIEKYDEVQSVFDRIHQIEHKLEMSRKELNKKILRFKLYLIFSICGLFLASLSVLAALLFK